MVLKGSCTASLVKAICILDFVFHPEDGLEGWVMEAADYLLLELESLM